MSSKSLVQQWLHRVPRIRVGACGSLLYTSPIATLQQICFVLLNPLKLYSNGSSTRLKTHSHPLNITGLLMHPRGMLVLCSTNTVVGHWAPLLLVKVSQLPFLHGLNHLQISPTFFWYLAYCNVNMAGLTNTSTLLVNFMTYLCLHPSHPWYPLFFSIYLLLSELPRDWMTLSGWTKVPSSYARNGSEPRWNTCVGCQESIPQHQPSLTCIFYNRGFTLDTTLLRPCYTRYHATCVCVWAPLFAPV